MPSAGPGYGTSAHCPRPGGLLPRHVRELGQVQLVGDDDRARRAVAVLGQDQVGLAAARVVGVEGIGSVQQHHVRVLLQRTRPAQVREHRLLVGPLLRAKDELVDRHHGYLELLGQQLALAGEFADLLLAGLDLFPEVISCS